MCTCLWVHGRSTTGYEPSWWTSQKCDFRQIRPRPDGLKRKFSADENFIILTKPTRNARKPFLVVDKTLPFRYSHFTEVTRRTKPRKQTRQAGPAAGHTVARGEIFPRAGEGLEKSSRDKGFRSSAREVGHLLARRETGAYQISLREILKYKILKKSSIFLKYTF